MLPKSMKHAPPAKRASKKTCQFRVGGRVGLVGDSTELWRLLRLSITPACALDLGVQGPRSRVQGPGFRAAYVLDVGVAVGERERWLEELRQDVFMPTAELRYPREDWRVHRRTVCTAVHLLLCTAIQCSKSPIVQYGTGSFRSAIGGSGTPWSRKIDHHQTTQT